MMALKRGVFAGGAAAVALAFGVASEAEAQNVTWNVSVWGKQRAFTRVIEALGEDVQKRTDGKFTLKVHYGEALSAAKENLDGIKIGAFQMAALCASYHPDKTPTLAVLDLPFLPIANFDVQREVHEATFKHKALVDDLARWNARFVVSGILPQYEFMGGGQPPLKIEDWKNKRVRALGGLGDAMTKLGAVPTTVPAPETYQLLERGTVDAVSYPFTYAHAAYKVDEISKWFTGNMAPGAIVCPVVASADAWSKLPPAYQQAIEAAKPYAYKELKKAYADADAKNLPRFRSKMKEIIYTPEQLEEFRTVAAKPVWESWVKEAASQGIPAQELLDLVLATAAKSSS